jgi:polyisoprenoid-binding protein YceI
MQAGTTDAPDLAAGLWVIDPEHSNADFEVGHPRIAKVRGTIPVTEGWIKVGPTVESSAINIVFDPAVVYTFLGDRDTLQRGPNFFYVASFPVWSFRSAAISRSGHQLVVEGDLTVHGLTRDVVAVTQFEGVELLDSGVPQAAFTADSRIDRLNYGLDWTPGQAHSHRRTAREVSVGVHVVAVLADPPR